jgi:flagellar biosynthetic protein FlhB
MAGPDDTSKTEKATPERRRKAREQGQFARARDAGGLAATLAVMLLVTAAGPAAVTRIHDFATRCFREPFDVMNHDLGGLSTRLFETLGMVVFPVAAAATLGGLVIGFAEAGFHPKLDLVMPKLERLDPLARLKTLLSPRNALTETSLAALRIGAVAYVTYGALRDALPLLVRLAGVSLTSAASAACETASVVALRATIALGVLAAADYVLSGWRLEKQLMMSKQEIKDEMKQQEGDGRVKHRARARARERLKRGLAKMVKTADVVVANPTHISVALRYSASDGAPVLVAKGYDEVALYIRQLARENGVPVLENRPLARAIAARVKVGRQIPVDLYAAVAEVLAFVYRLKNRMVWG